MKRRRSLLRGIAATGGLGLFGTGTTGASSTIYVDKDDPGAYDYIQFAINDANDGDTVQVTQGVYEGTVFVPPSKSLTLRGDPGGSNPGVGANAPIMEGNDDAARSGIILEEGPEAPDLVIEGFEIRNYGAITDPGRGGQGIKSKARANVTVRDCFIHDIAGPGITMFEDGEYTLPNWTIRDCRLDSCAGPGVFVGNVSDSRVVGNVVTATNPVRDDDSRWWERNTPDGYPRCGIQLGNYGNNGNSAVARNVTIADNELDARFDIAGIIVRSASRNGGSSVVRDVDVRDNDITLPDVGDEEQGVEKHGIKLDTNPGPDDRPAAIRNVRVEGNTVRGAVHAYKIVSVTGSDGTGDDPQGVADVAFRDNSSVESNAGLFLVTLERGEIRNVEFSDNTVTDAALPFNVWNNGNWTRNVTLSDNSVEVTADAERTVYGLQMASFDSGGVEDVEFTGTDVSGYYAGVILIGLAEEAFRSTTITDCSFTDNTYGVDVFSFTEGATSGLSVQESTLSGNDVGLITQRKASGDGIGIHYSDISGNAEYGVQNYTRRGVISAHCNFWGHPTGPVADSNRKGRGDAVTDGVDYDPWLPQSFEKVPRNACRVGGSPDEGDRGNTRSGTKSDDHPGRRKR